MIKDVRDWFGFSSEAVGHSHSHGHGHGHEHTHGVVDATISGNDRGLWAVKWSFLILALTAALQMGVVIVSGSIALLADTIHNIADATTAIPLGIAFVLARRKPTRTFTYGYGRVEDLAGLAVVAIILFSALTAGYQALDRFFHPQTIGALGWVAAAGVIGFIGNEAVAIFRIRVGREINSAALVADGYHARTDGLTSLAVVAGAIGVWWGFPLADPFIGLLITFAIFEIVWQSAKAVLTRMLDGVDPQIIDDIHHAAKHVDGLKNVSAAQARWIGHRLHADVAVEIDPAKSVADAAALVTAFSRELVEHLPGLADAKIRISLPTSGAITPYPDHRH